MAAILYKWLSLVALWVVSASIVTHPIFVSVTEIEHNSTDRTLEISCKIFTDDFEKVLRQTYHTHVDLSKPQEKKAMSKLVSDYVQKHLKVQVNGKLETMQFQGYEQIEEAIYSYYQVDSIATLKNIAVTDNILYEYQEQQISLLHITVSGNRKSTKLVNPEEKASFVF
ncbi:MAG: hypothetical protein H7258_08070 [Ferruginibacter sp.]|nr:hypothetical protein [Ferruginibacter sp.]